MICILHLLIQFLNLIELFSYFFVITAESPYSVFTFVRNLLPSFISFHTCYMCNATWMVNIMRIQSYQLFAFYLQTINLILHQTSLWVRWFSFLACTFIALVLAHQLLRSSVFCYHVVVAGS
jgi:hypothetical protein